MSTSHVHRAGPTTSEYMYNHTTRIYNGGGACQQVLRTSGRCTQDLLTCPAPVIYTSGVIIHNIELTSLERKTGGVFVCLALE